ncbi:PfkB family carbohydrate kinase [Sphingobium sp. Ant17]|uniref:PfkB family carbohydrate kinase n=2 Tax=unclassified Sphingobium TaxID=2611147 RepID=UPI0004BBDD04
MGHEGGLLAQRSGVLWLPAVPVEAKSAVGAGDSFLAAMTFALACGRDPVDAFRYGIAAGAAAVLTPGTDLCHRDEVERLYVLVDPGETPAEASINMAAHSSRAAEAQRA